MPVNTKDVVIMRKYRSGRHDIIALFPMDDCGRGLINSYMHIGQHGAANYSVVIRQTTPATHVTPGYDALLRELRSIGYNPEIRQHRPHLTQSAVR